MCSQDYHILPLVLAQWIKCSDTNTERLKINILSAIGLKKLLTYEIP